MPSRQRQGFKGGGEISEISVMVRVKGSMFSQFFQRDKPIPGALAAVSLTALLPRVSMDSNQGETMTYCLQGPFRTGRHESSESTLGGPMQVSKGAVIASSREPSASLDWMSRRR